MRYLPLFVVLVIGCAPSGTFERLARQDDAERIVWRELYGMLEDAPPPVEWVPSCWGNDGTTCGFTWIGWKVQVASHDETMPPETEISLTRYAHELMHYRTYLKTGDVDAAHWRGDWDLADNAAMDALVTAGL